MAQSVPPEAQQLVCVCANELGDVKNCGQDRQAAGAATLSGQDVHSEQKTGAIKVEQAHTVGRSAGRNSLKRVRTGAGAECFSLAEEKPHAGRTTRTAEKTR
jgi:hypothetical protein